MSSNHSPVALITGASRGIGAAIARRLAGDGFTVVINYAGDVRAAAAVAADIEAAGGRALTAQADVADPAAVRRMFDAAEAAFGGVDVLVNNAGVLQQAPLVDVDDAQFDHIIAINLKGSFNAMREAGRRLREGGHIINFSSSLVGTLLPTYGAYVASKAAVEGMTPILAKELRGRRITVNAVAPGPTATELFLKGKPEALVEQLAEAAPLERLGTPEDIANVVSFLAGPDGGWVNGQVLRANGGLV